VTRGRVLGLRIAIEIAANILGVGVALLVTVAMFRLFPLQPIWVLFLPGGVIWLVATPFFQRKVNLALQKRWSDGV
jgi:hypothetical protein